MSQNINLNSFKELGAIKAKFEIEKTRPKKRMAKGRFDEAWQMIRQLQKLYPKAFNQEQPLPLAIGTAKEIRRQHSDFNVPTLRLALAVWTRREKYLHAVLTQKNRHNLDGTVSAKTESSEKEYSKTMLEKKKGKKNEKHEGKN